jgi:hypothetical protein
MKAIRKMMFRIISDCDEATHRSWLSLRKIPQSARRILGLKLHLLVCRDCSAYAKNLNWVSETLSYVEDAPPLAPSYKIRPHFKDEIRLAIETRIKQESGKEE